MPRQRETCSCGKPKTFGAKMCFACRSAERYVPQDVRKECSRNWHLKNKYGLEIGEFDAWWIVFKGRCGICDSQMKMPENKRGQALDVVAVDHDHKTGKVRGLLCNACNKGLGLFYDDPERLKKAREYLLCVN